MLAVMTPLPTEGLGGRTWSQDGLVGLELESEPTEASAPVAAPLWEACMPTPEQEGSPPRHRARSVRFAVDETTPPRPARLLSSAERLDLIKKRPDLDVRDLPWLHGRRAGPRSYGRNCDDSGSQFLRLALARKLSTLSPC